MLASKRLKATLRKPLQLRTRSSGICKCSEPRKHVRLSSCFLCTENSTELLHVPIALFFAFSELKAGHGLVCVGVGGVPTGATLASEVEI